MQVFPVQSPCRAHFSLEILSAVSGAFMSSVFEIVLDIPAASAHEWALARAASGAHRARRDPSKAGVGAEIAHALSQAERIAALGAREQVVIRCLDRERALADAGWRLTIEEAAGGRRLAASHGNVHAPGVTIRDTVFDAPLEADPGAAQFDGLPSELRAAIDAAGELAPAATLDFERTCWRWTGPEGGTVDITLSDAFEPKTEKNAPRFRELRLTAGCENNNNRANGSDNPHEPAVRALFAAANELVGMLPAFASLTDAIERACRDAHDDEPVRAASVDLAGARTPHAALVAIGGNIARQWFGNEGGLRETATAEFVHQMRVAQRRLKTALKIFPQWADPTLTTRVAPGIKWFGGLLGEARDWDVFADSTLPALAAADTDAVLWSAPLDAADARRLEARARAQQALRSRQYAQLTLAWIEWLSDLALHDAPKDGARLTLHAYAKKRVRKYFKRLTDVPKLTTLDAAARHRERIQAKRLRYTLEFFEPIASDKTRGEILKTLGRLQGALGDGNDAAVALRFLEQLDVTPYQQGFARGWSEATTRYTAREGERLLRALGKPRIKGGA
jgi:CHAD domain-containing protein